MKSKIVSLAIVLGATFHVNVAHAGDAVNIEADQMEVIDAEHHTIFTGNVIAVRPKDSIKSDKMVVTSSDEKQPDGTTRSVTELLDATGNVVITTKTQTITGSAAKFYIQKDKLEVTGNVIVVQGTSTIKGTHLNVDLKTNHLQMTGGRVQSSFVPK
jgi:lipopolysaccharide export system protein LptA